jgi:hypothetical protein
MNETNHSSIMKMNAYEMSLCFQDTWVLKLPWAKFVVGFDGKVYQVKCKMCNVIEGRGKAFSVEVGFVVKSC